MSEVTTGRAEALMAMAAAAMVLLLALAEVLLSRG
jgi:hypothetical protein